jgi:hypothetical protein
MTKKHFEAIAKTIKEQGADPQAFQIVEALAELFGTFNPLFDAERFLDACAQD